MRPQAHRSDPAILERRTLEQDHRYLAQILRPGQSVLDVGCGTGAISAGIARSVGPSGSVIGVERDASLIQIATANYSVLPNLRFENADATELNFLKQFDIVTAARTLQWISEPAVAIERMHRALKRSGSLVILDYNHAKNLWEPDPPSPFRAFYTAFLAWRRDNGWDNLIADRLPDLLRAAGLAQVASYPQDEVSVRGEQDFSTRTLLWAEVIDNIGPLLIEAGYMTAQQLGEAKDSYACWAATKLEKQTLSMRTVVGFVNSS